MAVTVLHSLTATTPDDTRYEIRPIAHWNAPHVVSQSILASEISPLFSNKNGVSFGLDGTNVTASIAAGAAPGSISAGTTNYALGEAIFSNANGVSFGLDGQTVTATVKTDYLTTAMASNASTQFVQANAAFAGTSASGTIASNGISVSIGPYITTAALSNHSHGNPTLNLTNLSGTTNSASNGLTLSLSAFDQVVSANNGSYSFNNTLSFSNANGISFGTSAGSAMTASHNALTSQSNQNVTAGNGGFAFQTLSFSNANGFSFGTSAGSAITGSYTVPTQSNQTVGWYGSSNTTLTSSGTADARSLSVRGIGGISIGFSAGELLVSGPQTAAQSAQTVGWYGSSNTTLTSSGTADARSLTVRGLGGVSVGFSNGELLISGGAGAAQSNQTIGLYASSNTTLTSSGTVDARSMTFRAIGAGSVGVSNGEVLISFATVAAGGATGNLYAQGNTTQNSSTTQDFSSVQFGGRGAVSVGFSNGTIQISGPNSSSLVATSGLSISTNGSTITIGKINASFFRNDGQITRAGTAQANSLVSIQPFLLPNDVVFSNALCAASFNVATAGNNSSAYQDVSVSAVIYSRNVSTLSSVASFSNTLTRTWSSNGSQTVTGVAGLTASLNQTTLTAGEYWIAWHISTTNSATGGANTTALTHAISMILAYSIGSAANQVKVWGGQTNASVGLMGGLGLISTGATRASIAFSDYTVTGTRAFLAPIFFELRNGTYQL